MIKVRTLSIAFVTLIVAAGTCIGMAVAQEAAPSHDKDPDRIAAAMELIEVTGAKKQIELMLDVMKQGVRAGAREGGGGAEANEAERNFSEFTAKFQSYRDQMIEEFAALYADRFSAQELREISAFYKSGTGAKFIAQMPDLMQRGGEIGQRYGLKAVRELQNLKTKPGAEPKP